MVYAKSLLAFVFVFIAAFAAQSVRANADSNPCTVTPNGSGGWNVNCVSNPPTVLDPISQTYNGNSPDGKGTSTVGSGSDGDDGGTGGSPILEFPGMPGSFAIEALSTPGIYIQANGGDGGGGGNCDACTGSGGDGGHGGNGGNPTVTVDPNLPIFTQAISDPGVWVVSAGGRGGNGGDCNACAGSPGSGGSGGSGGNITLNVYDNIITVGNQSVGIVAQSLGGGGGNSGGGILNTGSGNGGASQNGGTVTVNFGLLNGISDEPASIATYGNNAIGILAQSIGGHGGAGGSNGNVLFGSGGNGGNAGSGGLVTVNTTSDSAITTFGQGAAGIEAESVGGNGGEGGDSNSAFYSSGGSGSAGGNGGTVVVNNGATIVTWGAASKGIFGQSIGGGGGDGGSGGAIVGLGGSGSSTSPGGDVTISNSGNITTNSTLSLTTGQNPLFGSGAIFAQSIGGGGGNGGSGSGLFSVGGGGGGGGNGGNVEVDNTAGTLTTYASDSNGIFAQTVGGGGGNGGGAVAVDVSQTNALSLAIGGAGGNGGVGETATVNATGGAIYTYGDRSNGVQVQSVGGGGGNGGFSISTSVGALALSIAIGGGGGGGGAGGTVNMTGGAQITTAGNNSNGILAQSLGGGGGNGGYAVAASGGGLAASFGMGGTGGSGGTGGDVTVANTALGIISTSGNNSAGIIAQSIGGGGGNGGFAVTGDIGVGSGGLAMGGNGSSGGNSGNATLTNYAGVTTTGNDSDALIAQSMGGGGGNGAFSVQGSASLKGGLGVALGGNAGGGGNAVGTVILNNFGILQTSGNRSAGLFAQSVGGGGGNGGFSVSGNLSAGPDAGAAVGGRGGGGGNGGVVHALNTGAITTTGTQSNALQAQSIGGGGGNGGWSVAGDLGAQTGALSIGIGGSGGSGGNGALVSVNNGSSATSGTIETYGTYSNGILAQSVGGGGGNGGFSVAGTISGGASVGFSLGGSAGGGGFGNEVDVSSYGNIFTGINGFGDFANGILAQSIGGGGGNGGFSVAGGAAGKNSANIGIAGGGGSGGDGGDVTLANYGTIATNGYQANGILSQSVGGMGGNGGFAVAGGFTQSGSSITLSMGGGGGTGGNGGTVMLANSGSVQTLGDNSPGLSAQSIGGGGGNGGFSVAAAIKGSGNYSGTLSLGGKGGTGGTGGSATVINTAAQLYTTGNQSAGILAQSIGGGGGNGGFSVGAMGTSGQKNLTLAFGGNGGSGGGSNTASVTSGSATTSTAITTLGGFSDGILAQSLAGGGGNGGWTVEGMASKGSSLGFSLGGNGGSANDAGSALVTNYSAIQTSGVSSNGIAAQSIGAGGGSGGFNDTFNVAKSPTQGAGFTAKNMFNYGNGGGAGNGGAVTVNNYATILTGGANSNGILAESTGGGGGYGGFSYASMVMDDLGLGSKNDGGGDGGTVNVNNHGSIGTSGDNSVAILAQSAGGGGGVGGFAITAGINTETTAKLGNTTWAMGSNGGFGGKGGTVNVTSDGTLLSTTGANSDGILAESIGAGGGSGGNATDVGAGISKYFAGFTLGLGGNAGSNGDGGNVTVTNSSSIVTTGDLSNAILAQSIGGGGGNGGDAVSILGLLGANTSLAVGGNGSGGGGGGTVSVTSSGGAISTSGFGANGIVAQSIGGGGGNGGSKVSGVPDTPSIFNFTMGGNNASGGNGGSASIVNSSAIATSGIFSSDLFAQSLAGGAGTVVNGIFTVPSTTMNAAGLLGATGGAPGNAGAASASNAAQITTNAFGSAAMVAQSIAGGGGIGENYIALNTTLTSVGGLAFGTSGITGNVGNSSSASETDSAIAATNADASDAMLAQSITGGGGLGIFYTGSYSATGLTIAQGASTADLGTAGTATVTTTSNAQLQTLGYNSNAIAAQSISGGGGTGDIVAGSVAPSTALSYTLGAKGTSGTQNTGGAGGNVTVTNGAKQIVTNGDLSNAILAQSIGGGGGDAALKIGGSLSGSSLGGILGGSQLSAGSGGTVSVTNTGTIGTNGNGSLGVLAQSIGGGGGFAGFENVSGTVSIASLALGGSGDSGTSGGAATIANSAQIVTGGAGDAALLAQSIGGGGGADYAALNLGTAATALNLLAGENGGSNNIGGAATATNTAQIVTSGVDAFGVAAQSIGGGGGDDPLLANGTLTTASSGNQLNMQLGGSGSGSGNNGGVVSLTSNVPLHLDAGDNGVPDELDWDEAPMTTVGDGSVGVLGQSIGAGGGTGYLAFNGAFSTGMPKNAVVQLGSAAGQSGDGNNVTIDTSGGVITGNHPINGHSSGAFAVGILGQSIGGGGGDAVLSMELGLPTTTVSSGTLNLNVGGHGAGNGGTVSLSDINGSVLTIGGDAQAVAAQSIGGGGGYGAVNVFGPAKLSPVSKNPGKYTLNQNVGGNGSTGNGGAVNITQSGGVLQTTGDSSEAILAQSIGGGGGIASPIHTINEFPATWCSTYGNNCSVHFLGANIAVGGNASHGNGGAVTVSNTGAISTSGEDASAILAQSIGGGGGLGGDADIIGGPSLTLTSGRTTTVGGTHGASGDGNTVSVTDAGAITTTGDNSSAIFAQSIGGGGGVGGLGLGNVWGTGTTILGGSGGASGNGGAVNVTVNNPLTKTNEIVTTGKASFGIFAQSVGGGGGLAGDVSGGVSTTTIGEGSKTTATGGGGGNGGAVTVVDNGNIKTSGSGADGIFAQSIGGGGGLTTGYAGSAGAAGNGGAVSVTQNGIVETTGSNANAIFAQSAGGTGTGGNVSVTVTGMALAYGANSDGILAQSIGGAGNGNISITINSNSVVQGGTGSGSAGVKMLGGNVNTLVNNGTITTAGSINAVPKPLSLYETDGGIIGVQSATQAGTAYQSTSLMTDKTSLLSTLLGSTASSSGVAVSASGGTLNFTNNGNIYGSIALSGTALNFTNSGTYVSGSTINLGAGTLSLTQGSVMTPGAGGFVASTDILGNFIEQTGSDYLVTLDLTDGTASLLNITGTASLGGSIDLDLLSTNAAAPGAHSDTIVMANGGLTNNGAALTPPQSAVATFNLGYLPNALQLNYDVNYAPTSGRTLSANDLSFGNYIGTIQTAGSTPALASFMSDVFAVPTIPKLKTFYDRFTPSASVALGSSALFNNLQFSDDMLRCPAQGVVSQSGSCSWARLGTESSHESGTFSSVGYGQSGTGFAYGFQHRIGDGGTSIGAAIHYTKSALFANDSATSLSGNGLEAGLTASRMRHDGILLSADFLGGEGHYNSARQIGYPSITTMASGSQAISYIGAHLRAEKRFGGNLRAVTPFFDAGLTRVNVGALFESGAGTMNENVAPYHAMYPTISSGVRLEDSKLFHGSMLHGTLDLSLTQLVGNPQTMTTATLQSAPEGVAPFAVTNTLDRTQFNVGPALDITRGTKTNIRIGASYSFSKHTHTGGAYIQFKLTP